MNMKRCELLFASIDRLKWLGGVHWTKDGHERGLKTSKRDASISRRKRLRYIVYWWFITNRKWLISWCKIFFKVWSFASHFKNPRGLILKIVPHLWSYEASLGKQPGTFAFKAFRALAAALEDDQRAAALASLPPFRYLSPFFCPLVPYYNWLGLSEVQKLLLFGMSFQIKFGWQGGICNLANWSLGSLMASN